MDHVDDDTPRTRTDVVDRAREWPYLAVMPGHRNNPKANRLIRDLLAEVESLRAERVRLRAALRPFAECMFVGATCPADKVFTFTVEAKAEEMRAARAALETEEE